MLVVQNIYSGILKDISFNLKPESFFAIQGPSGSGKTTLLNTIAGNIKYKGHVQFKGQNIDKLKPWERPFKYLNQHLYLFPYLTVENNLRLAQYAAKQKNDKNKRLAILEELGIKHLASCYPQRISGGEQQRAALARALISSPELLMLDEPFANLDWALREKLWGVLREIKEKHKISILFVSHEPREIDALADERVIINDGRFIGEQQ